MIPWVLPAQYQQPPPSIHLCKSRESQVPTKESFVAIVSAPGASSCTSDSSSLVDLTSDECISGRQLPPQSEMSDGPRCGMVRPKNGSVWLPGHFTLFITGLWSLWCWSLAEIVSSPLTMVDSGPGAFFATASHSLSWNHALTTTFYWFVIMDKRSKLMTEGREPGKLWTFILVLSRLLLGGVPWAGDVQRGQLVHQRCATSVLDGKPSGGQDDDYNVNIADYSNDHDSKNKADNVFLSRVVTTRSECGRSATTLSPSPTRRSKPHVRSPFCFF